MWTLENNGTTQTPAEWGINTLSLTQANQADDVLTFNLPKSTDIDIPFTARKITLYKAGVRVFTGRLDSWSDQIDAPTESLKFRAVGPSWYAQNLIYRQRYATAANPDVATGEQLSDVLLGTAAGGTPATIAESITDILDYMRDNGAPIGTWEPSSYWDIDAPVTSASGITCQQALQSLLTLTPNTIVTWHYATACPTPCITPFCQLPERTLTVGVDNITSLQLAVARPRPAGVDISYITALTEQGTTAQLDSLSAGDNLTLRRHVTTDSWPDPTTTSPFGRLQVTVDLTTDPTAPQPVGLARRYYESIPCRLLSGTITLQDAECSGPWIGRKISIAGSRAIYAENPSPVQSVTHAIDTGTTTITIGHPEHLSLDSFITQQRALQIGISR